MKRHVDADTHLRTHARVNKTRQTASSVSVGLFWRQDQVVNYVGQRENRKEGEVMCHVSSIINQSFLPSLVPSLGMDVRWMDGFGDSRHTIVGRRGDASHAVATVEFICPQGAFSLDNHLSELLAIGCHHPLCPNKDMFTCLYFYQRTSLWRRLHVLAATLCCFWGTTFHHVISETKGGTPWGWWVAGMGGVAKCLTSTPAAHTSMTS